MGVPAGPHGHPGGGTGARDVRPHRGRLRPHELGDDRRAAPPLARAGRRPRARSAPGDRALDVAAGTGDLAIELARRVAPGGEVSGTDFSEEMLERARAKSDARHAGSGRTRSALPYADDELRRRDRRLRRAQLLRPRPRARGDGARGAARAAGSSCWRSRPRRSPRSRSSSRSGSTGSCPRWAARRRPGRLRVPAELVKRFPGPEALGGRLAAAGLDRRALDPHRGRDHRHPRRDGAVSSAEEVLALVEAGGAHVPALMTRLEERLEVLATSHGELLASARGRDDPRRRQAAAAAARLPLGRRAASSPTHDGVLRAAVAVELIHSATLVHDDVLDAAPLRRGRPTVVATAGRAIATATGDLLFSPRLRRAGAERPRRTRSACSPTRAPALARGELLQREDAWDVEVSRERYLLALRPQDRAAVPGGVPARARSRAAGTPTRSATSAAGSGSRSSCSTTCSTSPAPRSGPASTAAPTCSTARSRCRSSSRASAIPSSRRSTCAACARPRRPRPSATRSPRPACSRRRARRRWRWWRRRRPTCRSCPSPSARRSSWWPTRSPTGTR